MLRLFTAFDSLLMIMSNQSLPQGVFGSQAETMSEPHKKISPRHEPMTGRLSASLYLDSQAEVEEFREPACAAASAVRQDSNLYGVPQPCNTKRILHFLCPPVAQMCTNRTDKGTDKVQSALTHCRYWGRPTQIIQVPSGQQWG